MATYCYITDSGDQGTVECALGCAPRRIKIDGVLARRDYAAEAKGFPPTKGWPIECIGSGVNAEDAGELRKHLADRGVPTEITPDGNPIYRDPAHRRKALKARGLIDKASFV